MTLASALSERLLFASFNFPSWDGNEEPSHRGEAARLIKTPEGRRLLPYRGVWANTAYAL